MSDVAGAFSIWTAGATGSSAIRDGMVLIMIGIPVYALGRGRRADVALAPPA